MQANSTVKTQVDARLNCRTQESRADGLKHSMRLPAWPIPRRDFDVIDVDQTFATVGFQSSRPRGIDNHQPLHHIAVQALSRRADGSAHPFHRVADRVLVAAADEDARVVDKRPRDAERTLITREERTVGAAPTTSQPVAHRVDGTRNITAPL